MGEERGEGRDEREEKRAKARKEEKWIEMGD